MTAIDQANLPASLADRLTPEQRQAIIEAPREKRLETLAAGLARGERLAALMQTARIWDSRQALVERALHRAGLSSPRGAAGVESPEALRLRRLAWAMRGLSRLDRAAKGLLREDAWDELKQLGLALMNQGKAPAFM